MSDHERQIIRESSETTPPLPRAVVPSLELQQNPIYDSLNRLALLCQKSAQLPIIDNTFLYYPKREVTPKIDNLPLHLRRLVGTVAKDMRWGTPITVTYQFGAGTYGNEEIYHAFEASWVPSESTDIASIKLQPELPILETYGVETGDMEIDSPVHLKTRLYKNISLRNGRGMPVRVNEITGNPYVDAESERAEDMLEIVYDAPMKIQRQWLRDFTYCFNSRVYH